jgi:hypothetical protein
VAKHIVAAGLADRCEIQVAYAIGVAHPLSVNVETFGTGRLPDEALSKLIGEMFDLRPGAIIRDLELRRPIYQPTAAYGHFGRADLDLPWERLSRLDALKAEIGSKASAGAARFDATPCFAYNPLHATGARPVPVSARALRAPRIWLTPAS